MASKRELIEPHKGDKRYVRRDDKGHFKKEVNVGRSLAADRRAHAKKTVKPGQGDVWAFMERIVDWIRDSSRQGMPT